MKLIIRNPEQRCCGLIVEGVVGPYPTCMIDGRVVVADKHGLYPVGHYSACWRLDLFTPLPEEVKELV